MPLRTRCGTSRLPCMSLGVRAQGLGPRGGGTALAITICSVLPSVPYDAVGPPKFILLSRLNIQPARLPVNASPLLSRTTTHDSGPIWFATPSLGGTCTRETYRFVPAHRLLKYGQDYIDIGERAFEERFRQNHINGLKRAANALGYTLTPDTSRRFHGREYLADALVKSGERPLAVVSFGEVVLPSAAHFQDELVLVES